MKLPSFMLKKWYLTFYRCNILDVYYKKAKNGDSFVTDWLRNRNTLEYLGIWERMYNPDFNYGEFAIIIKDGNDQILRPYDLKIHLRSILTRRISGSVYILVVKIAITLFVLHSL